MIFLVLVFRIRTWTKPGMLHPAAKLTRQGVPLGSDPMDLGGEIFFGPDVGEDLRSLVHTSYSMFLKQHLHIQVHPQQWNNSHLEHSSRIQKFPAELCYLRSCTEIQDWKYSIAFTAKTTGLAVPQVDGHWGNCCRLLFPKMFSITAIWSCRISLSNYLIVWTLTLLCTLSLCWNIIQNEYFHFSHIHLKSVQLYSAGWRVKSKFKNWK